MEKLIEKTKKLQEEISNHQTIIDIKQLKKQIEEDNQLLDLIKKYQISQSEELKLQIIKNPLFRQYKEKETELNLLILEINSKLKTITKKDKCSL